VKPINLILSIALALGGQVALAALWPEAPRYVDLLFLPTAWYALGASQRSGMLVGCLSGLLQDAWFQTDVFGLNGFNKTVLGWALGGLSARFDVRRQPARFAFGALAALVDGLLSFGLRRMLDQTEPGFAFGAVAVKALVTGSLVVLTFGATRRIGEGRSPARVR
jgi:rod shape-determining protein MreD